MCMYFNLFRSIPGGEVTWLSKESNLLICLYSKFKITLFYIFDIIMKNSDRSSWDTWDLASLRSPMFFFLTKKK